MNMKLDSEGIHNEGTIGTHTIELRTMTDKGGKEEKNVNLNKYKKNYNLGKFHKKHSLSNCGPDLHLKNRKLFYFFILLILFGCWASRKLSYRTLHRGKNTQKRKNIKSKIILGFEILLTFRF